MRWGPPSGGGAGGRAGQARRSPQIPRCRQAAATIEREQAESRQMRLRCPTIQPAARKTHTAARFPCALERSAAGAGGASPCHSQAAQAKGWCSSAAAS